MFSILFLDDPLFGESFMGIFFDFVWDHLKHFLRYRAVMLYIEDGKVVAMRLNIGTTSEECLRKEAQHQL